MALGKGKFYSVGVGPGDPRLITYRAVEVMGECDVIAVPKSGGAENEALKIAQGHIDGKETIICDMPMVRDAAALCAYHDAAAQKLEQILNDGRSIAFITLGDPSVYSTTMYIHNILAAKGFSTEIIPGVPSFCAAAASLNTTLCEGSEPLVIIPASYENAERLLAVPGNKVLMKSGKSLAKLKGHLRENYAGADFFMVERASMEGERVFRALDDFDEDASYFSIILVKENGGTPK